MVLHYFSHVFRGHVLFIRVDKPITSFLPEPSRLEVRPFSRFFLEGVLPWFSLRWWGHAWWREAHRGHSRRRWGRRRHSWRRCSWWRRRRRWRGRAHAGRRAGHCECCFAAGLLRLCSVRVARRFLRGCRGPSLRRRLRAGGAAARELRRRLLARPRRTPSPDGL